MQGGNNAIIDSQFQSSRTRGATPKYSSITTGQLLIVRQTLFQGVPATKEEQGDIAKDLCLTALVGMRSSFNPFS